MSAQNPIGRLYKVFNTHYRNVTKFHICGHLGDKIALHSDETYYTLPGACYWISGKACNTLHVGGDKSCAQIFGGISSVLDEKGYTAFERMLYGIWAKHLGTLQAAASPLSTFEWIYVRLAIGECGVGEMDRQFKTRLRMQVQMEMEKRNTMQREVERKKIRKIELHMLMEMGRQTDVKMQREVDMKIRLQMEREREVEKNLQIEKENRAERNIPSALERRGTEYYNSGLRRFKWNTGAGAK
ncbi:hypothetical protein NHQ30_004553 [Ciborinia camelliae]|nr:hypothetical protein NHQ30_004553 [Ciborinia camelliae]